MKAAAGSSVEVEVAGLTIDPMTNMPIVVLRDLAGTQQLPIWIGLVEASSIATQIEKIELTRPMTHDLMKSLLEMSGATLDRVEVCDLREDTFFANLQFTVAGKRVVLDSRPSDAIALALRTGARIFVAAPVMEAARRADRATDAQIADGKQGARGAEETSMLAQPPTKWAEMLEKLSPDSFKFKM